MASTLLTVRCGPRTVDVSVPDGTTVGAVLNRLGLAPTTGRFQVTLVDGRRVAPGDRVGQDLGSGALLHVGASNHDAATTAEPGTREERSWVGPTIAWTLLLGLASVAEVTVLLAPALGWWPIPAAARVTTAVALGVLLVAALVPRPLRRSPWGLFAATALLGGCSSVVTPLLDAPTPAMVAALIAWAGLVCCLGVRTLDRGHVAPFVSTLWLVAALTLTVVALADPGMATLGALLLAVATLGVAIVPNLSFRMPERQLLHLPAVTTSATVRAPEVLPPSRITGPRIRRSLIEADDRSTMLLLVLCVTAGAAAFPTSRLLAPEASTGWAALVLLTCAGLSLFLLPRGRRDPWSRILPRLSAVAVLIATLTSPAAGATLGPLGAAGLLLAVAFLCTVTAVTLSRARESALLGHLGDVTGRLSLHLLLPAAVMAGHVFDMLWQVLS
ncbi:hypothetical protein [Arachnia propionica]|uniref:EccD-like transmembrane domain-containing protein n=1 Tax=Arachnia propionica TaxID=1750 RepID=A0A3P1WV73_9ACTN|nr:hypothetical protein [Arachnia propionica]RRD48253.1 hypothetical protein EII35_13675 [Arachnia propionica]